MNSYKLFVLLPLLLLTGCSEEAPKAGDKAYLLEGHQKAIDKAKGLDKVIQEGIEKRQAEVK